MARCAADQCGRWRPDLLAGRGSGTWIDGVWFCSRGCVERMVRRRLIEARPVSAGIPVVPPMRLGALLRHHGVCGADAIERALTEQRGSQLKLGEQLCAMGAAAREGVLRALAAQAGVGYLASVEPDVVRRAPGGMSPHAVRALGLVPISEPEEEHIRVACPAPVPRLALGAFRRLTGWVPEAYLVSDDDYQALLDNYATDVEESAPGRPLSRFVRTGSLSEAAARIAAAATREREATVTEAAWDPYTWVRIQGLGQTDDVVFARPRAAAAQEEPCLADPTSH